MGQCEDSVLRVLNRCPVGDGNCAAAFGGLADDSVTLSGFADRHTAPFIWRWQQWNSCGPAAGWLGEDIPGAWNFVKGMRKKKAITAESDFFFLKTRFALTIGFSSFTLFSKNEIADYW